MFTDSSRVRQSLEKKRYTALAKWTDALESVHLAVVSKTATGSGRVPDPTIPGDTYGLREIESRWN